MKRQDPSSELKARELETIRCFLTKSQRVSGHAWLMETATNLKKPPRRKNPSHVGTSLHASPITTLDHYPQHG